MDFDNDLVDECNVYDVGFRFACVLDKKLHHKKEGYLCGRIGYTGPTGRTGPCPDPSDPTAYYTHTSLAQLLASSSLLVEVYPSF